MLSYTLTRFKTATHYQVHFYISGEMGKFSLYDINRP